MLAPLAAVGSPAYIQLALTVTLMVGPLQLGVGALRLGSLAHFISPRRCTASLAARPC